jgi:hypothetical protein
MGNVFEEELLKLSSLLNGLGRHHGKLSNSTIQKGLSMDKFLTFSPFFLESQKIRLILLKSRSQSKI